MSKLANDFLGFLSILSFEQPGKSASKVLQRHKVKSPSGKMGFLLWTTDRFERLNAARTSAAADGSTEANNYFHPLRVKIQTNLAGTCTLLMLHLKCCTDTNKKRPVSTGRFFSADGCLMILRFPKLSFNHRHGNLFGGDRKLPMPDACCPVNCVCNGGRGCIDDDFTD